MLSAASIPHVFLWMRSVVYEVPVAAQSFKFDENLKIVIQETYETGRTLLQSALTLIAVSWGFVAIRDISQGVLT
jgi:hypothetical protein